MTNKHLFLLLLAAFFAPLAMKAQSTLTVHDGTETSERVPIFSWHANVDQQSQLIYPASELAAMSGKALTQMVFYWQQGQYGDSYSVGTWTISLGETTATTFNGGLDTTTPLTEVFTGVLDEAGGLFNTTDHTLTIAFDEEYAYQGGNLLVQFAHTGTGEDMDYRFIGQSMDKATSYLCCIENGNAYIDEPNNFLPKTTFTYQAQPNCAKPTNLAISYNEGDPTATVTWTSEATNFNIDVNGTITAVTGNSYTFDVSLITTYTIKVQADCGDEQSYWTKAISFFSGCGIFPVTYSYGFEDESDIDCWTIITTGYNGEYTGIYEDEDDEDYAHTGSHSFRFYYTTEPGQYLISPELGGFENGLHVEFWYREYSEGYPETFQVGYSTTDNDPDSFTWGTEITATTSYRRFKANYPADTKYVAVKHTSDYQYFLYLDDFLFEESPSCIEPTGIQVADATTHGATVSWTAGGSETAWDIFVTADATIVPDDNTTPTVANTNNNPYSLSNLSAGTIYYVYVRAICSGTEVSEWSNVATFATECEAVALPYYENFNAGLPLCWNTIFDMSNTDIVTQPKTSPTDPDKILIFQRHYDQNYAFAVLPEIDARYPLNGYQMSFDACYYYFETNVKLSIGVMTDPADSTTFVSIDEVDIIDSYDYSDSGFGTYTVYFNNYTGNGRYIAIRDNNINSEGYVLIDNIVVSELPSCLSPTGLTANAASTSAELSWTANNGESSWTLYWKESGAEAYTEVPDLTENSYTLNGLSAATAYQFYVVAHCDETDHSAPSSVYTFATNCDPITLPWSENFEGLAGEGLLPVCWNTIADNPSACYIGSTNINNNNVLAISMSQSSNYAGVVLPVVDADYPLNQYQISFDAGYWSSNNSTTGEQLYIFIMTDPNDLQTVDFYELVDITDGYPNLGRHTLLFNSYEGNGQYIALFCFGGADPYTVILDNIEVTELPSCLPPTNLAATNITGSSAQLAWTVNGEETAWDIFVTTDASVQPDDSTTPTVAATADNPYSLTGLNPLTTYYVYVRVLCGDDGNSDWSNRATFTTKCATTTVDADNPYTQNFNGETFPPECWELGEDVVFFNWQNNNGTAFSYYYGPIYLYMPILHLNADNAVLTFKTKESRIEFYTGGSEGYDGLSIVKVSTDGGGTWTQLWCPTIDELTTTLRTITLSLYDYVGQDILIAFEHQGPHGWTIDDVEVKAAPLASFTKEIDPYDEESKQGWYLIASPLDGETDPTAVANLIAEDDSNFALFRFNQDADLEWENYKVHEEGFKLVSGQGYLYANTTGEDLTFTGGGYCGNGKVTLHTTTNAVDFPYMNLIGNPFGTAATLNLPYYRMNENGSALKVTTENGEVAAMEGVFVYAYDDVAEEPIGTATFTEVGRSADASHSIVNLNVEHNRGNVVDNAIIRFDEGRTLPKFTLNEGDTKLYIPQNGKDYAIVRAEASGEMPVNFRAKENGTYSLSFSSENVSFSYLHLIDNMTGADVDLLVPEPAVAERSRSIEGPVSYTFTAKTTDYASRFKLVFVVGSSTGSDAFAFYSNGNWIISNEGQATLQVIDVNGRILSSEAINGSVNKAIHAAPGVYMLRLINGDNVRTQKVVVR